MDYRISSESPLGWTPLVVIPTRPLTNWVSSDQLAQHPRLLLSHLLSEDKAAYQVCFAGAMWSHWFSALAAQIQLSRLHPRPIALGSLGVEAKHQCSQNFSGDSNEQLRSGTSVLQEFIIRWPRPWCSVTRQWLHVIGELKKLFWNLLRNKNYIISFAFPIVPCKL